ncbi:hypothetical protein ANCCAN_00674 [Ancylostoma caninum]|uniref:Secreted protein n=1 Tax=Ancylostoma caninum TaxID=29170 RepID=A0A368H943_ANCCA|nr:hypothetical protein ANCCAN_00674 [Ancylostoma caninum]
MYGYQKWTKPTLFILTLRPMLGAMAKTDTTAISFDTMPLVLDVPNQNVREESMYSASQINHLSETKMSCTTGEKVPARKAVVVHLTTAVMLKQDCVLTHCQLQRQQQRGNHCSPVIPLLDRMVGFSVKKNIKVNRGCDCISFLGSIKKRWLS